MSESSDGEPQMLRWARQLQALSQDGLAFTTDPFDIERYHQVRRIAAEMVANLGAVSVEVVEGVFASEHGYATPKIDVRGAIFRDERILLVRERSEQLWTLPGGWADPNESASEATAREVREETGFTVRVQRLLALYDRAKHSHVPPFLYHVYKAFFLCVVVEGQSELSLEVDEIAFFAREHLPPLSLTRITSHQINRLFELRADNSNAVDFD